MRSWIILACLSLYAISCNNKKDQPRSFWEQQKDKFKYKQKNEFASDSSLFKEYTTLTRMRHPLFDSLFHGPAYLYSWQERDGTKTEFTIIKDAGELGLKMFYFILDKNDKLLSVTQVSNVGYEGGYIFETNSKWISRDTMLNIGATTELFSSDINNRDSILKGDTTLSYFIVDRNGQVTKKKFKEVKALDFDN
jgi:hypothetical protein